eukprot:6482448-Amphidinium_carterae.1
MKDELSNALSMVSQEEARATIVEACELLATKMKPKLDEDALMEVNEALTSIKEKCPKLPLNENLTNPDIVTTIHEAKENVAKHRKKVKLLSEKAGGCELRFEGYFGAIWDCVVRFAVHELECFFHFGSLASMCWNACVFTAILESLQARDGTKTGPFFLPAAGHCGQ